MRILSGFKVVVEEVSGHYPSQLSPGDYLIFQSGLIQIPEGKHFCLYALQAVLPSLPAKQRATRDEDWLKEYTHVVCPDPDRNVLMRLEPLSKASASSHWPD